MNNLLDGPGSDELPEVSAAEMQTWVSEQAQKSNRLLRRLRDQWEGEQSGDLPPNTFDPEQFENMRRMAAIFHGLQRVLLGVYGSAPHQITQDEIDDQFFEIIGRLYGWQKGGEHAGA